VVDLFFFVSLPKKSTILINSLLSKVISSIPNDVFISTPTLSQQLLLPALVFFELALNQ